MRTAGHNSPTKARMNIEKLKEKTLKLRAAFETLRALDPAAAKLAVELEPLLILAECGYTS
jgi:hypothetical protein